MRPSPKRSPRGQALVEFALVVPTLITMLLFSMYFVEFVRAKLKVQEASRFVAWEMTSFALSDYGGSGGSPGRHAAAFNIAKTEVVADAVARYQDLDSIDQRATSNLFVGYSNVAATVTERPITPTGNNVTNGSNNGGGPIVSMISNAITGTVDRMFNQFQFNVNGKAEVEVTANISSLFMPKNFLNDPNGLFQVDQWGGTSLQNKPIRNRYTLVANGWHLPDGTDALMTKDRGAGGPRAGVHAGGSPHGIYLQVKRMQNLSITSMTNSIIPGLQNVTDTLAFFGIPDPFQSSFAVAHNYGLNTAGANPSGGNDIRRCADRGGRTNVTANRPGKDGLNNLDQASVLDYPRLKCYDTAPFRDRMEYGTANGGGSQYMQMFIARGQFFMGCVQPQADDPGADNLPASVTQGDKNTRRVACGP